MEEKDEFKMNEDRWKEVEELDSSMND